MDSSPRSSHLLRYGHITCAHWEEERKNLSDTVTIQYSDQSGTANFAPLQKPHRYRSIQYVVRVGARANITLVSMLIDVTTILIFHFHLYSQVEGGRLDRKYAGLHNRLYFFCVFQASKGKCEESHGGAPDTRVFAFLHPYIITGNRRFLFCNNVYETLKNFICNLRNAFCAVVLNQLC